MSMGVQKKTVKIVGLAIAVAVWSACVTTALSYSRLTGGYNMLIAIEMVEALSSPNPRMLTEECRESAIELVDAKIREGRTWWLPTHDRLAFKAEYIARGYDKLGCPVAFLAPLSFAVAEIVNGNFRHMKMIREERW